MARSSPMAASTSSAPGQGRPVLPDRRVSQNAKLPRAGIARLRRPESDLQRRPRRHVLVADRMEGSGLCGSLRHGGGLRCGHVHTDGHNTLTGIPPSRLRRRGCKQANPGCPGAPEGDRGEMRRSPPDGTAVPSSPLRAILRRETQDGRGQKSPQRDDERLYPSMLLLVVCRSPILKLVGVPGDCHATAGPGENKSSEACLVIKRHPPIA